MRTFSARSSFPAGAGKRASTFRAVTGDSLDHVRANAEVWQARTEDQMELARRQWSAVEPSWGIFSIPESSVGLLPPDLDGADAVELGCGTAYVSAWLARRGSRPVGVDPTPGQLVIARRFQDEFDLHFPLLRAAGEQVPLQSGRFDLVISEYGAAIWADPYHWIREAARLLRPGGQLVFLGNSTLLMLCAPDEEDVAATDRLLRDQFGMHRFEWPDDPSVEFHLSHGDWIRLLRANGFEIEDLLELRPAPGTTTSYGFVTVDWARRWPCEEAWRARRR
jgi:SAM-dependent methyltransferase